MREVEKHSTSISYPIAWGMLLREMRDAQGWTQAKLGLEANLTPSLISHWENGEAYDKFRLSRQAALSLAKVLAGRDGGLERPADVVAWLGLLGFSSTEEELARLRAGERWKAGIPHAWVSRYQVPPLPTTYTVRTELTARVKRHLLDETIGNTPLVLTGMAGVGKSTLAAALAADREVRARLPDGVLWTRISSFAGETGQGVRLGQVLRTRAQALGMEVRQGETEDDLTRRLTRWLEHERVLLVIDDVWKCDEIQGVLIGGPGCRTIVTTRNRGLARDLPAGSPLIEVGALNAEEAERLLVTVLGEAAAGIEHTPLRDVVAATEGNALALIVAGKDAKVMGVEQTLADLRDPRRRLRVLSPPGAEEPNRSVAASFSLGYGRLGSEWQRYYRALAQLPGPQRFTVQMFQAVAGVSDRGRAKETLRGFVYRSLLQVDGEGYRLHPLLSEYARSLLEEAGEWDSEHGWVERYEGEWVEKWRQSLPSVPRAPGARVRAAGGWRRWSATGIREFSAFWRRGYDKVIAEGWDPHDVPLERWIVLTRLKRRQRAYLRRGSCKLVAVFLGASVVQVVLAMAPVSLLAQPWLLRWRFPLLYAMGGVQTGCIVLAMWLGTVTMIDLHRLWHWR